MKKLILLLMLFPFASFCQVDMAMNKMYHRQMMGAHFQKGLDYYKLTSSTTSPIQFSAQVSNIGFGPATNVHLKVDVYWNSNLETTLYSDSMTICGACVDSLTVQSLYTPTFTGNYDFVYTVLSDSVEWNTSNDSDTTHFELMDDYINPVARDNGIILDTISQHPNGPNDPASFGNVYQFEQAYYLNGFEFQVTEDASNIGQLAYCTLYTLDTATGEWTWLRQTSDYAITDWDVNSGQGKIGYQFFSVCYFYQPGEVLLAMVGHYGGSDPIKFGQSQVSTENSVMMIDMAGTIDTVANHRAVMVRPLMDCIGSVPELESSFNIELFPNPSYGNVQIQFELEVASEVSVVIRDLSGRNVKSVNLGNQLEGKSTHIIDLEDLSSGHYWVLCRANDQQAVKSLIRSK